MQDKCRTIDPFTSVEYWAREYEAADPERRALMFKENMQRMEQAVNKLSELQHKDPKEIWKILHEEMERV